MSHRLSIISAAHYSVGQYEEPCHTIDMENGYAMHASVYMALAIFGGIAYI